MNLGSFSTSSQTERDAFREAPYDSAYVNVSSITVPTLPMDESTLMEKVIGKPIKKVPVKKFVESTSTQIASKAHQITIENIPAKPQFCRHPPPTCLCGSPECHGAEAYDALVNKAADIDFRRAHVASSTVSTSLPDISTQLEKKTEKPLKLVPEKKSVEKNQSKNSVLPTSPATCLCGSPECHGAEAYEFLVNKPRIDDREFGRAAPAMMQHPGTFNELREYELVEGPDDSYPVILPLHSCPSPSCAKEYENLVKKAQTVDPDVPWKHVKSVLLESREHDYINLTLCSPSPPGFDALPPPPRATSRAHQSSPPPSPQFPGPRRCCSIM